MEQAKKKIGDIKKGRENILGKILYRPLAEPVARFLARFNVSPNSVTTFSIFVSLFSGAAFAFGEWRLSIAGAVLLQLAIWIDYVDGSLARYTVQATPFGKWWDEMANKQIKFFVLLGMSHGAYMQTGEPLMFMLGAMSIFHITYSSFIVYFRGYLKQEMGITESLSLAKEKKGSFFPSSLIIYWMMTICGLFNLLWFPLAVLSVAGFIWIYQIMCVYKAFKRVEEK